MCMTRIELTETLNSLYPTYQIGMNPNGRRDYLVLARKPQMGSTNPYGCWEYWEVMCYCPKTLLLLDTVVDNVLGVLRTLDIELTGNITPDFYDEDVKAYMRSIEFRIPKEV